MGRVGLVEVLRDPERVRDGGVGGGVIYDWDGVVRRSIGVVRGGRGADRLAKGRDVCEVDPDSTIGNAFHVE